MEIIIAAIAGGAAVFLIGFVSYSKFSKILKQCICQPNDPEAMLHKGKYYNKNMYIQLRAGQFASMKPQDLATLLKNAEKKLTKSKEIDFDRAEVDAIKLAMTAASQRSGH